MKRTQNTFRNTAVSIGGYILIFLFGIVIRRLFLENISIDNLGYEGLFANIFYVLTTLDFGAGSILLYRLYKAVSAADDSEAQKLIAQFARFYRIISLVILIAGIALMPFLQILIRDPVGNWNYVYTIYLIQLFGSAGVVYLTYYRLLLEANQRLSDAVTIETVVRICFQIVKTLVILYTKNYILYTLSAVACNLISAILIAARSRKRFSDLFHQAPRSIGLRERPLLSEMKNASVLRVTQTVNLLTDTILVSAVLGIRAVALYGNYTMIGSAVVAGFRSALRPVSGSAGNYAYTEDPAACYRMFRMVDLVGFFAASFVFTSLCTLFQPTISFLFGEQYLLPMPFVLLYGLISYLALKDNAIRIFRETIGEYRTQRGWAVAAAISNIGLSIFGIRIWGVAGVLAGTLLSSLLMQAGDYLVTCRFRFLHPTIPNITRSYGFLALALAEMLAALFLSRNLPVSFGGIALRGLICLVLPNTVNALLFFRSDSFGLLRTYVRNLVGLIAGRQLNP